MSGGMFASLGLKLGWKFISGFFKDHGDGIVFLVVVAVLGFGGYTINSAFQKRADDLRDKERAILDLTSERDRAVIEKTAAQATLTLYEQHQADLQQLIQQTYSLQTEIKQQAEKQEKILREHDLTKIRRAHPELLEKKINQASQERMNEIQNAINGD